MPHPNGTVGKLENSGTIIFRSPFQAVILWKTADAAD
jgi:hypothetical protein